MIKYIIYGLIFTLGEVLAYLIFQKIDKKFRKMAGQESRAGEWMPIVKGILERFFVYFSLLNGFAHALSIFGALKIGTRLDEDKKHKVSNDYFFIGNLISVLFAISYLILSKKILNQI